MNTYLDLLPDELSREIYKYLYADVMYELEFEGGAPVYPINYYYCFCRENSDYIRHKFLKRQYKEFCRRPTTCRQMDWFKFIMDLERPTVWTSILEPWNSTFTRRWEIEERDGGGGIRWYTAYDAPFLSFGGWERLLDDK